MIQPLSQHQGALEGSMPKELATAARVHASVISAAVYITDNPAERSPRDTPGFNRQPIVAHPITRHSVGATFQRPPSLATTERLVRLTF